MHSFNYEIISQRYLTPEIVSLITKIHEYKGRQDLFIEANKDELNSLLKVARIQSTGSSNRIEGIFTTDERLKELVQEKIAPPRALDTKKDLPHSGRSFFCKKDYSSTWATTLVARTPLAPRGSGSVSKVTFWPSSSFL